jgi:hypothetical protein
MAHASTTFDRHFEGKPLLDEVPTGVDTKAFDWHFEGQAVVAEAAAGGGPSPHYVRRAMRGGMIGMGI